ncbi:MAG: calcineurin-like phosphoesterase C-terminal domain-containing protein, partial [Bacteroidales bacterium]|nr:calcineurin-like phosphoesterase C-terminal domain-containing protein [Bacteroidales bacterium]
LPQFYYIHKPNGSPDLEYKGSEPTGPLPKSIDFALLEGQNSDEFSMLVFSDPQAYNMQEVEFYKKDFADELRDAGNHVFGITLGDIVGDTLDLFRHINAVTAKIGIPWFHVPGNHDMNFDARSPFQADESFESHYGPSTYAFNQGKVHFIVLNDVIFPNDLNDRFYTGGLREYQFQFIENSLKHAPHDYLVVLFMHIPIFNEDAYGETFIRSHRDRLFKLLKDRPFTLSLSGHTHYQKHTFFSSDDGWLQESPHHHYNVGTASGDWWSGRPEPNGVPSATMRDGTPNGYNILRFKGNQYQYEYIASGKPSDYKMRLYGPRLVSQNQFFSGEFSVNFFQGSEKDTVLYRINEGEWRPMQYTIEHDPYINALRYEYDQAEKLLSKRRPSYPVPSFHLWKTRVSTRLSEGKHTLSVEVRDHQGQIFRDQMDFMVEKWNEK